MARTKFYAGAARGTPSQFRVAREEGGCVGMTTSGGQEGDWTEFGLADNGRIARMSHEPDWTHEPSVAAPRRIPRHTPGHLDVPGLVEAFAEKMM
jgi:hypothetical protein